MNDLEKIISKNKEDEKFEHFLEILIDIIQTTDLNKLGIEKAS